jgi:peptide/nickel transport system substrate-binding protein
MQASQLFPLYVDPAAYPSQLLPSAQAVSGGFNAANYRNPQVDSLLQRQAESIDKAERASLMAEVLKQVSEDLPYLPMWWQGNTLALQNDLVYQDFNGQFYLQPWLTNVAARA